MRVIDFSDAFFSNNHDLSSQLRLIILLADERKNEIATNFKSYIARIIVCSAMVREFIEFSAMFNAATTQTKELKGFYGRAIPLQLFTDSKSLFNVISKGLRTSEKRLVLQIAANKLGLQDHKISDITFI